MNDRRQMTLVAGASSTGKTTFALRYLLNAPVHHRFIFDPHGDFARMMGATPAENFAQCDWQARQSGWALYCPGPEFDGRGAEALEAFAQWAWRAADELPGQKVFVADDVTIYGVDPYHCPAGLATLAQAGRKKCFHLMLITHEPNRTHGTLMGQLTEAVSFQLLDSAADEMGRVMQCPPEELAALAPGQWRARNLMTGGRLAGALW